MKDHDEQVIAGYLEMAKWAELDDNLPAKPATDLFEKPHGL